MLNDHRMQLSGALCTLIETMGAVTIRNCRHLNMINLIIIILNLLTHINGFNLETRLPIVKKWDSQSYFGYSVAEHLIINDTTKRITEAVMLVGAPRAQSGQPGTNHSGIVLNCSLTTYRRDCRQIKIDQDTKPPDDSVSKDNQWLGVTVRSQGPGGYVMTCAHRYILKGPDYQWGQGICYSLSQYLDFQRAWEPCYNRPVVKAHEQFGYCQAGTSGEITEDFEIVIGSPGPYTWRGTVFANSIRFRIRDDKTWYLAPVLESESPVDKYSYLGMSVASGKFFDGLTSYVGGAPRANGTGQVLFFTKHKGESVFNVNLILNGEQFASSYGYSMTTLDCNGDGLLDLVVGAPFYYSRTEGGAVYIYINTTDKVLEPSMRLTGKPESRFGFALSNAGDLNKDGFQDLAIGAPYEDGGVVYIYLGSSSGVKENPSQVIKSSDLPIEAGKIKTFGYSLSGAYDLDQNGYPDLLIGAYASDTIILLRARPIIDITTLVKGKLTQIDPNAEGCEDDRHSKLVCFSFDACFQLNSTVRSSYTGGFRLHYRIEAETYTGKKYYRVKFLSAADSDTPNIVEKDIAIRDHYDLQKQHCSKEVVYLKDKSDIQNPVMFKLTYSLIQKDPRMPSEGDPLPDINKYPILNQEEAHRIFSARFLKECGSDEICQSDLIVQAELNTKRKDGTNEYILYLGEEPLIMTVKVINRREPAYDANMYLTHPSSLSYVGKKSLFGDQVDCRPQNKTVLKCDLGNPFNNGKAEFQLRFNPSGLSDAETSLQIEIVTNTTSADISKDDDRIVLTTEVIRNAELELSGNSEEQQVQYGGEVKGEAAIKYEDEIGSRIYHKYIVRNGGPWRASRIDVNISWPYQVENGQWDHGKWLLYLTGIPQVSGQGGKGYCNMGPDQVNPLKYEVNTDSTLMIDDDSDKMSENTGKSNKIRKKREMVILPREVRAADGSVQRVVTMKCGSGARCFNFTCVILDLAANQTAVIRIPARLWNATLVEDYPSGVNYVIIKSNAEIRLDPSLNVLQDLHNDFYSVETKAIPDVTLLPTEGVSLIIIIIAVVIGLILLLLLILILWRFGFFERKKYMAAPMEDKDISYN